MKLSKQTRSSTGSAENILNPTINDEFQRRSFQNAQILRQFNIDKNNQSQTKKKCLNIKKDDLNQSKLANQSKESKKERVPLQNITQNINNFDSFDFKSKNRYEQLGLVDFSRHSKKDDKNNANIQFPKLHVSFSYDLKQQNQDDSTPLFASEINSDVCSDLPIKKEDGNMKKDNNDDVIANLEKQNDMLLNDLRENCKLLNSLQKRLDLSTKELVSQHNEITTLKAQNAELNQQLKFEKESKNTAEFASNGNMKDNMKQLLDELDAAKKQIESLTNDKTVLLRQIESFKRQNFDEIHCKEQNKELAQWQTKNLELENMIIKLKKENENLSQFRMETKALKQELIKMKEDSDSFSKAKKEMMKENEELKQQLQELVNKSQTRNNQMYDAYGNLSENESDSINLTEDKMMFISSTKSQQCDENESFVSDISSEFSFTDVSEQEENQNSPKHSVIQQLICLKQNNKKLRESNAKLEAVASTAMSNYTDAINKLKLLKAQRKLIQLEQGSILTFEKSEQVDNEKIELKRKIEKMEEQMKNMKKVVNTMKQAQMKTLQNIIKISQEQIQKNDELC